MINDEARIQVLDNYKRGLEKYKCVSFAIETASEYKYQIATETASEYKYQIATETASEYKYQIAIETVEQNTSKQVSAKETALQNVCKYSNFFFLE